MGPGIWLHAGAIPPELGQLGALEQLLLSTNELSGKRNNFTLQQFVTRTLCSSMTRPNSFHSSLVAFLHTGKSFQSGFSGRCRSASRKGIDNCHTVRVLWRPRATLTRHLVAARWVGRSRILRCMLPTGAFVVPTGGDAKVVYCQISYV